MQTVVSIPGIHCAACATLIKDVSSEFSSIKSVDVDIETKKVTLDHDENLDMQQWKNEIESLDRKYAVFFLINLMTSQQCTLDISGMHCASCSALITRKLKKIPGVEEANVNLAAAKAHVRFDSSMVHEHDLVAAVKAAGYKAEVRHEHGHHGVEIDRKRQQAEIDDYRRKFLIGFVLSLPMLAFMVLSFLPHSPIHEVVMPYMGIVSLVLATPVQFWLGSGFFRGFWSSLKMGTFSMDSLIAIGTYTAFFYSVLQPHRSLHYKWNHYW
jgi:Cu+-exporting ATPase